MAKQIYIDSNGNEVLVSGTITNDNNLPHFSGTPTAGSTAYEIASKQGKIQQTTISGTTDGTGDISLTGLPITQYRILSCIKVRDANNQDVAYCVLGGYSTGTGLPYAHLINSSNQNYANKSVDITVNYIEL